MKKKDKRLSELEKIEASGKKTPLEIMLAIMHNKKCTASLRLEAAAKAAPYVHRKMPMELETTGEVEIIPPFVPSRGELAKDFKEELGDEYEWVDDDDLDDL